MTEVLHLRVVRRASSQCERLFTPAPSEKHIITVGDRPSLVRPLKAGVNLGTGVLNLLLKDGIIHRYPKGNLVMNVRKLGPYLEKPANIEALSLLGLSVRDNDLTPEGDLSPEGVMQAIIGRAAAANSLNFSITRENAELLSAIVADNRAEFKELLSATGMSQEIFGRTILPELKTTDRNIQVLVSKLLSGKQFLEADVLISARKEVDRVLGKKLSSLREELDLSPVDFARALNPAAPFSSERILAMENGTQKTDVSLIDKAGRSLVRKRASRFRYLKGLANISLIDLARELEIRPPHIRRLASGEMQATDEIKLKMESLAREALISKIESYIIISGIGEDNFFSKLGRRREDLVTINIEVLDRTEQFAKELSVQERMNRFRVLFEASPCKTKRAFAKALRTGKPVDAGMLCRMLYHGQSIPNDIMETAERRFGRKADQIK